MLPISIENLVREYSPAIYRFIFRLTRDESLSADIVQETFIKCWKNSARYSDQKASLKTWVFTIAYRTALDHLRKSSTRKKYEITELLAFAQHPGGHSDGLDSLSSRGASGLSTHSSLSSNGENSPHGSIDSHDDIFKNLEPLPHELFEQAERKAIVEKAVAELRPEYRNVISLHHESELSFGEIAAVTGMPANTLKSQYRRALQELRKGLAGKIEVNN